MKKRSEQKVRKMRKSSGCKHPSTSLVYSPARANRTTIRRLYHHWRKERGLPDRCDNTECVFYSEPLIWNGKPLPLILDHIEGNNSDNRPEMLRYLCPACESQLPTRGGANRGRVVDRHSNGFQLVERDGRKSYTYFPSGGMQFGGSAEVAFVPAKKTE